MDVFATELPDVKIFAPRRFTDSRGYFSETYTRNKFAQHAPGLEFIQDNESYSRDAFTVRGLHYQAPPYAQDKLVRVVAGAVYDVAVDVREGSETFAKWVGVELSAENGRQLLVPKGFLHGFMTLVPDTIVSYKVTAFYDGPSDGAVLWSSPELAIAWPAREDQVTLSAKDGAAPRFSAFRTPFSILDLRAAGG